MARPVTIDHERVDEYIRINCEYETVIEMAKALKVSTPIIYWSLERQGLKGAAISRRFFFERETDVNSIHYWPTFEEMNEEWHDALIRIMTAVFFEDGRSENEGCDDLEARKTRMKTIRPPAVYDVQVQSPIVREYLEESGYRIKQQR